MSLISQLTVLLSLWTATLTSALPLPMRDLRQADGILKVLLSVSTGQLVVVDVDGNVTADAQHIHERTYFYHRHGEKHHEFESGFLNGSFLHFVQLENINGSGNGTIDGTGLTNDTVTTNSTANDTSTITSLHLRVGDMTSNQTHLHLWKEQSAGAFFRYYVENEEGVNCYLAFERDGSPVEDPCSVDPKSEKVLFQSWVQEETS